MLSGILDKLRGGDRRQIGRSEEVAREVTANPKLFPLVLDGMLSDDPLIRMRAADAIEKVTRNHPEFLQPFKQKIIQRIAAINQQEVRWHVAQMLPRLRLTPQERSKAVSTLLKYLQDKSSIVQTCSMQALSDFAIQSPRRRPRIIPLIERLTRTGSPAVRNRGRKLLRRLQASDT